MELHLTQTVTSVQISEIKQRVDCLVLCCAGMGGSALPLPPDVLSAGHRDTCPRAACLQARSFRPCENVKISYVPQGQRRSIARFKTTSGLHTVSMYIPPLGISHLWEARVKIMILEDHNSSHLNFN